MSQTATLRNGKTSKPKGKPAAKAKAEPLRKVSKSHRLDRWPISDLLRAKLPNIQAAGWAVDGDDRTLYISGPNGARLSMSWEGLELWRVPVDEYDRDTEWLLEIRVSDPAGSLRVAFVTQETDRCGYALHIYYRASKPGYFLSHMEIPPEVGAPMFRMFALLGHKACEAPATAATVRAPEGRDAGFYGEMARLVKVTAGLTAKQLGTLCGTIERVIAGDNNGKAKAAK